MDTKMPASTGARYRVVVEHPTGSVASVPMTLTVAFDEYETTLGRYAGELGPGGVDVYVIDDRDWRQP